MRVFSGIQPTGETHIGNYFGALKQWVELQDKADCIFCVVDLHSLTVPYNPANLKQKILEKVSAYLAAGINPKKSIIFVQSEIQEHTELCWLLSTVTPIGDLQRMTQYKEKAKKYKQNVNAGLLNYPILMAADILLYDTDLVPIGTDQMQHLELTREIARRFNKRFNADLKIPKAFVPKKGAKIYSLNNPQKKMSKTDSPKSYLSLFDKPEVITKKISSAQTDSGKEIKYNPEKKPGISNLLTIYSLLSENSIPEVEKSFKNKNYQVFKKELSELLIKKFKPFREKKQEVESRPGFLEKILADGKKRAQIIASQTIRKIKKKMGLTL